MEYGAFKMAAKAVESNPADLVWPGGCTYPKTPASSEQHSAVVFPGGKTYPQTPASTEFSGNQQSLHTLADAGFPGNNPYRQIPAPTEAPADQHLLTGQTWVRTLPGRIYTNPAPASVTRSIREGLHSDEFQERAHFITLHLGKKARNIASTAPAGTTFLELEEMLALEQPAQPPIHGATSGTMPCHDQPAPVPKAKAVRKRKADAAGLAAADPESNEPARKKRAAKPSKKTPDSDESGPKDPSAPKKEKIPARGPMHYYIDETMKATCAICTTNHRGGSCKCWKAGTDLVQVSKPGAPSKACCHSNVHLFNTKVPPQRICKQSCSGVCNECRRQENGRIPPATTKVFRPECRTLGANKGALRGRTDLAYCEDPEDPDVIQVWRVYAKDDAPEYVPLAHSIQEVQQSLDYLLGPQNGPASFVYEAQPQASAVDDASLYEDQNQIQGAASMPFYDNFLDDVVPVEDNLYQYPANQPGYIFDGGAQGMPYLQQWDGGLMDFDFSTANEQVVGMDGPLQPLLGVTAGMLGPQQMEQPLEPAQYPAMDFDVVAPQDQGDNWGLMMNDELLW